MARKVNRLTAADVKRAESGDKPLCDGNGLYLLDGAHWAYRYAAIESTQERAERKAAHKRQGERQMGLGPVSRVDLPPPASSPALRP